MGLCRYDPGSWDNPPESSIFVWDDVRKELRGGV
jgi:hypothetical protein